MSLTVFTNFRIETNENFIRMKDSFYSFNKSDIQKWVINFRGKYKLKAKQFLDKELGSKLISFNLESKHGWFHDTKKMLTFLDTDYILYWIEDHICLCSTHCINEIIDEMHYNKIDYLGYSWFGLGSFIKEFETIKKDVSKNIYFFCYGVNDNKLRQKKSKDIIGHDSNIISAAGIFSKDLFYKIIFDKRPYLRRWPKETPFDFEKKSFDTHILPIKMGIPKKEMFANIDDDNLVPQSSLISRGLYEKRIDRESLLLDREDYKTKKRFILIKAFIHKIPMGTKVLTIIKRLFYHL